MSGYFGALMRSSGLAIGGHATAHVEPSVAEIAVERSTPAMQPHDRQTASTQLLAAAPIPVERAVQPSARPGPPVAGTTPAQAHPRTTAQSGRHPPVAAPAVDASGKTLLHAAMQWVAADPRQVALAVRSRARPLAELTEQTGIAMTQALPAGTRGQPSIAMVEHPLAPVEPTARESVRPQAFQAGSARPDLMAAPPTGDEVVEISIGAIHVRVDAPAAQTVARPLAPPPAAAVPARSPLARRVRRRI